MLLAALVIFSLTPVSIAAGDISSLVEQVMPGVVLIKTYDSNGNELGQGSGFVISKDGDVATCYHVMRGYSSANVTTSDSKEYRVKNVTALNKSDDLARISLATTEYNFKAMELNTTMPKVGQEVIAIGGPLGLNNTVSQGIVSAIRENKIQITAPISPGSSGGPVFNMNGEVIGIVSSQMKSGQNLNFAIPVNLIPLMEPASFEQIKELREPMTEVPPDNSKPIFNESQAASDATNLTRKLTRYGSVMCEIRSPYVQIRPNTFLLEVATNYPPGIFFFIAPLYATYLKQHPEYKGTLILNAYALKESKKLLMTTAIINADARMNYEGIDYVMEKNAKYTQDPCDGIQC